MAEPATREVPSETRRGRGMDPRYPARRTVSRPVRWGTRVPMASNPTYEQSKKVAEDSRETEWKQPSFGKELFLGDFRLDLIHPQPEVHPEARAKGDAFLRRLRTFLTEHVDPQEIELEGRIPENVIQGLKDLGALGMKIPQEYGGLGLSQVYYN